MSYEPHWLSEFDTEDINFIKKFILASGSLKEIAKYTMFHIQPFVCGWTVLYRKFNWLRKQAMMYLSISSSD